jgi:outer membrane lipoprotein-sorting protein
MNFFFLLCLFSLSVSAKSFVPSSFSASFEESILSQATGKEKTSSGKVDYQFPGHIRYEVIKPNPSNFVSNPSKSWYYVPPFVEGEAGQVTIQKSNKLPLTKFLDSIKNGLENSKLFTHKYQGHDLILTFVPTIQKEMTLKEVTLHSSKEAKLVEKLSEFEKMTLIYNDGRKVNLKFIDLKENVSFPSSNFQFVVPKNTKVTNG